MSHSADNYKKIRDILTAYEVAVRLNQPDSPVKDLNDCVDEICDLIGRIENAECQKGKDVIKEEISEIITQVEKNNDPNDKKYWENLYCELRNTLVRIDV